MRVVCVSCVRLSNHSRTEQRLTCLGHSNSTFILPSSSQGFILSGAPGGLDYLLLVLEGQGVMSRSTYKHLSSHINTWVRGPLGFISGHTCLVGLYHQVGGKWGRFGGCCGWEICVSSCWLCTVLAPTALEVVETGEHTIHELTRYAFL